MPVKTNERELAVKVVQWFNEHINRMPNAPFTGATAEPGIKSGKRTYFGDVVVWEDRRSKKAYSYIELKKPFGEAEDLETFGNKAVELGVSVAYTWDFRTLKAYEVKDGSVKLLDSEDRPVLGKIEDWLQGHKQADIKAFISRICAELAGFSDRRKFSKFKPDKVYFVNFIREKTRQLIPVFEEFVREKSKDKRHKGKISEYAVRQGIHLSSENEYYGLIAKQTVYGIVTKIIFYMTIRRWFEDDLPPLISEEDADVGKSVRKAFLKAQEIDWQAVFSEGPIEELGLPGKSFGIFRQLFAELKIYNFGELPEDVVGELFEEIIDPEERHSLGQFYTNTDLVDLIIGCVVHDCEKTYADPTCGSGTFLIRLYDRLRFLKPGISHEDRLGGIWGIDMGKFPAELSAINLFRQQPGNRKNFPRVVNRDVFQVKAGEQFEFPPLRTVGANYVKIKTKLPEFEALVGNFPFIRQEIIEKKAKGFKKELTKLIAEDWLFEYADMFDLSRKRKYPIKPQEIENLKSKDETQIKRKISKWVDGGFLDLKLSGQADIYAYLFIHCSTLLGENGQIAIITSNSWLDAAYGEILKKFLLRHFKVKMIVASWAEPWFQDAAVNTVFTVLEKEKNAKERENNTVRFVKLKKKLSEIVPQVDLEIQSRERWEGTDRIVRTIETSHIHAEKVADSVSSFENCEMRVRMIGQKDLESEVAERGEMSKWGKFLRAPDVYFEIVDKCKDKLVPLSAVADVRRGITTGINDFFYLEPIGKAEGKFRKCKNARGWSGGIEGVYLKSVLRGPRESDKIKISGKSLKKLLFVCDKSKSDLKKLGHVKALNYIEWGEKQRNRNGTKWTDASSVQGRRYWHAIPGHDAPDFIHPRGISDSYKIFDNSGKILSNDRLFEIYFKNKNSWHFFLASSLFSLFIESEARVSLGEGLLDLMVYEVSGTRIPKHISSDKVISDAYSKLSGRKIMSVFDEIRQDDRQTLDKEILKSLGLGPEILFRIYEGLAEMVNERLELPGMRKTIRRKREKVSYEDVKKSVTEDCIGEGVTKFPDGFYFGEGEYEDLEFDAYPTTGEPLEYEQFMVEYKLKDGEGSEVFNVKGKEKAHFAQILSKQPDMFEIRIPKDGKIVKNILKQYNSYRKDLKERIINDASGKLHDWAKAERLAEEIFEEWGD